MTKTAEAVMTRETATYWLVLAVLVAVMLVAVLSGCEKGKPVTPPDAPQLSALAELQKVCWSMRIDWHYTQGWEVTAKWYNEGALGTSVAQIADDDLDNAMRSCLNVIRASRGGK